MLIRIATDGTVSLDSPDDFRAFAIAAPQGAVLALGELARLEGETHAWVSPAALQALTPRAQDPDWQAGFAAMRAYAARKGWSDDSGAIRAHIERY
jgi:hypothetical protein